MAVVGGPLVLLLLPLLLNVKQIIVGSGLWVIGVVPF